MPSYPVTSSGYADPFDAAIYNATRLFYPDRKRIRWVFVRNAFLIRIKMRGLEEFSERIDADP